MKEARIYDNLKRTALMYAAGSGSVGAVAALRNVEMNEVDIDG